MELKTAMALSSLRRPFRQALQIAAELGLRGVEINARADVQLQSLSQTGLRQIRKWLADYRLAIACVSFPTRRGLHVADDLDRRLDAVRRALSLAGSLGCRLVSLSLNGWEGPSTSGTETLREALQDLTAFSLRAGAWPILRIGNEPIQAVRDLIAHFPEESMGIDFDPAGLLIHGQQPLQAVASWGCWIRHVRVRDATRTASAARGIEVQLGRGEVDFPGLLGSLDEYRYRGYLTIESSQPDFDPWTDGRQAVEFLGQLFA